MTKTYFILTPKGQRADFYPYTDKAHAIRRAFQMGLGYYVVTKNGTKVWPTKKAGNK